MAITQLLFEVKLMEKQHEKIREMVESNFDVRIFFYDKENVAGFLNGSLQSYGIFINEQEQIERIMFLLENSLLKLELHRNNGSNKKEIKARIDLFLNRLKGELL